LPDTTSDIWISTQNSKAASQLVTQSPMWWQNAVYHKCTWSKMRENRLYTMCTVSKWG